LFPEVSGKIVSQSKKLVPGGRFRAGERMLGIDSRDYNLAVKQQRAAVQQAQMELATERARGAVAKREWSLIDKGIEPTAEGKKLALREIQLETAEAALASAESGLERAIINKSRTEIRAPFSCIVTEEFVDKGQVIGPSMQIATIVDSDLFWIRVSVPMDKLSWIRIPGMGAKEGSSVRVVQNVGPGKDVERRGRVTELLSDVDPRGKMARLIVAVENPLGLKGDEERKDYPLLLGAFVNAYIEGPTVEGALAIPRTLLRDGQQVWLERGGKLDIVPVELVWATEDEALVRGNITEEDRVVVTSIASPIQNMPLKLLDGMKERKLPPEGGVFAQQKASDPK
jgi:RND family efflux transporter MFP subunit